MTRLKHPGDVLPEQSDVTSSARRRLAILTQRVVRFRVTGTDREALAALTSSLAVALSVVLAIGYAVTGHLPLP